MAPSCEMGMGGGWGGEREGEHVQDRGVRGPNEGVQLPHGTQGLLPRWRGDGGEVGWGRWQRMVQGEVRLGEGQGGGDGKGGKAGPLALRKSAPVLVPYR
jgi:hypothetical protein